MVSIRVGRLRLLSACSTLGDVTPEPIQLVSACPTVGCADARVRFCVTVNPDGLLSRDNLDWLATPVRNRELVGRQSHAPQQIVEPRIRAQRVKSRIHLQIHHEVSAFLISLLKEGEGLIALSQGRIGQGDVPR